MGSIAQLPSGEGGYSRVQYQGVISIMGHPRELPTLHITFMLSCFRYFCYITNDFSKYKSCRCGFKLKGIATLKIYFFPNICSPNMTLVVFKCFIT